MKASGWSAKGLWRTPGRGLLVGAVVVGGSGLAWAHYPMLAASAPIVSSGQTVRVRFHVGHPFANDRFDVRKPSSVVVFRPTDRSRRRSLDAMPKLRRVGTKQRREWLFEFTPEGAGDYVVSVHSRYKEQPRRDLEDYSKIVIHCRGQQIGWDRYLGDPLEILPLTRPYHLPVGATFRGQVLRGGRDKPYAEAWVEAETYSPDRQPRDQTQMPDLASYRKSEKTDPNGCFSVTLDKPGWWLISVATDGGPGRQTGLPNQTVKRAVLWVFVGPWQGPAAGKETPTLPDVEDPIDRKPDERDEGPVKVDPGAGNEGPQEAAGESSGEERPSSRPSQGERRE